ncbi:MAG: hypothetical protein ACTS73_02285 [Arsenophonus sp. NEOnobi-MAG3]
MLNSLTLEEISEINKALILKHRLDGVTISLLQRRDPNNINTLNATVKVKKTYFHKSFKWKRSIPYRKARKGGK